MHRVSDMIGKAVVSVNSGEKLGTVSDGLLEPGGVRLIGLVVRHGVLGNEHVLPLSDLQTVGRDALLVRSDEHLVSAREWRKADVGAARSSSVRGRRVVTAAGEEIGHVSDFLTDEQTGGFGGLEVESTSLGGLRSRRIVVPASSAPRVGPDAVVIKENALASPPEESNQSAQDDPHTDRAPKPNERT